MKRIVNWRCIIGMILFFAVSLAYYWGGGGGGSSPSSGTSSPGSGGGQNPTAPSVNDSASSTIGSTGGILATPSGNATLNVPTTALSGAPLITISQSTAGDPPGTLLGSYEFQPDSLSLNVPATINLQYDPASIPQDPNEADLKLAYASGGQWVIISNSTVD